MSLLYVVVRSLLKILTPILVMNTVYIGTQYVWISLLITCHHIQWLAFNKYEFVATNIPYFMERETKKLDGRWENLYWMPFHNISKIVCQLVLIDKTHRSRNNLPPLNDFSKCSIEFDWMKKTNKHMIENG